MHGNGIAFAPLHNMEGRKDESEHHGPLSREWCYDRGLPAPFLFDNRQPKFTRARLIVAELGRIKSKLDTVAFFGWAGSHGIEAGFLLEDAEPLARMLCYALTNAGVVEFFALDPVLNTTGLCADAGFADAVRTYMHRGGSWRGQVIAHATGPLGRVSRIFEGASDVPGVWVTT